MVKLTNVMMMATVTSFRWLLPVNNVPNKVANKLMSINLRNVGNLFEVVIEFENDDDDDDDDESDDAIDNDTESSITKAENNDSNSDSRSSSSTVVTSMTMDTDSMEEVTRRSQDLSFLLQQLEGSGGVDRSQQQQQQHVNKIVGTPRQHRRRRPRLDVTKQIIMQCMVGIHGPLQDRIGMTPTHIRDETNRRNGSCRSWYGWCL